MFISPATRVLKSRLRYFVSDLPKLLYLGPRFSLGHFTLLPPSDSEWLSLLLSLCLRLWRRLFLFDLVFCLPVSLMCFADGSLDSAELESDGSSTSPSAASALSACIDSVAFTLRSAIVGALLFTLPAAGSPATALALVLEFPAMRCPRCKAEISAAKRWFSCFSASSSCSFCFCRRSFSRCVSSTSFASFSSDMSESVAISSVVGSDPFPSPCVAIPPAASALPQVMELSLRSVLCNSLAFWKLGHKIAAGTYGAKQEIQTMFHVQCQPQQCSILPLNTLLSCRQLYPCTDRGLTNHRLWHKIA